LYTFVLIKAVTVDQTVCDHGHFCYLDTSVSGLAAYKVIDVSCHVVTFNDCL